MYRKILSLILICSLSLPLITFSGTEPVQAQSGQSLWLLNRINTMRAGLDLHAYVWNAQLAAAAQQHSDYMAATLHGSHVQDNGSTPASRAAANGYSGSWVSENIYWGTNATAASAFNWWMNSPVHYSGMAHRRNNEIGIGVTITERGGFYTLVFGYRASINAPPAQALESDPPPEQPAVSVPPVDSNPPPASNPQPAAPRPTRRPPTLTFTPSPTIPTMTPTITWTPTATWTVPPTATSPPPTTTPFALPTAAIIAMNISATPEIAQRPPGIQETAQNDQSTVQSQEDGSLPGGLLPLLLIVQAVLIGAGIYSIFFRKTS